MIHFSMATLSQNSLNGQLTCSLPLQPKGRRNPLAHTPTPSLSLACLLAGRLGGGSVKAPPPARKRYASVRVRSAGVLLSLSLFFHQG